MNQYLKETALLNFSNSAIQQLIREQNWQNLSPTEKVTQIYTYVRDVIPFGYNVDDNISASNVLKDGYGQCNTKSTLLMALLRAVNIPNRIHGFTIHKALQKGAITGIWYKMAPKNILHSWVEVLVNNQWYSLEGVILDKTYLNALQQQFSDCGTSFCGYGTYTENFQNPTIDFNLNNTFIQEKGINQDFGLFNDPDTFYQKHQQKINCLKKFIFRNWIRHLMNNNVHKIRQQSFNV